MCQAYRSKMTQKQGFVWLLPGWYKDGWFDTDDLALKKSKVDSREARKRQRSGVFSFHPSSNTKYVSILEFKRKIKSGLTMIFLSESCLIVTPQK